MKSWKNITLASDITFCYFMLDEKSVSEEINVEGGSMNGQVSIVKSSTKEESELVYTTRLSLVGKFLTLNLGRYQPVNLHQNHNNPAKIRDYQ